MDSNPDPVREPGGPVTRNSRFMGTPGEPKYIRIYKNISKYTKNTSKHIEIYQQITKKRFLKKDNQKFFKKSEKSLCQKRRDSAGALPQNYKILKKKIFLGPMGGPWAPV